MKYHFKIYKEEVGYSAQGIELIGCFTQGDTWEELYSNMQEALNLHVDEPDDSSDFEAFPDESIKLSADIVEVPLDPQVASRLLARNAKFKDSTKN